MEELLTKLNDKQKEAVSYMGGPLLVLAGAGSGKTRVLTYKIAYMLESNFFKASNILAITFTNKAANEMKERVEALIKEVSKDMWIGTFHSVCVKILKREISALGYTSDFNIIDEIDKNKILKEIAKKLEIDTDKIAIKSVASTISKAKDKLIYAKEYEKENENINNYYIEQVSKIYKLYEETLRKNNSLDFDDLIFTTVTLFQKFPEILEKYQNRFKYILVDEYQDINYSQFVLVDLLAKRHKNITVVGDESQSIYGFRGADISNILNFENTYEDAKIIKLEQNYRSTKTILNAANSVIKNNTSKIDKKLWTENDDGEKIEYYIAKNEYDEAEYIANNIDYIARKYSYSYSDFAILYRTNTQSRVIEEMFIREGTPYKIIGGMKFYQRKEIKDLTAYLKLINNPKDNVSFERIINEPKRGIGDASVKKIIEDAEKQNLSAFEYIADEKNIIEYRSRENLKSFVQIINTLIESNKNREKVSDIILKCIEYTGYKKELELENTLESKSRLENIYEYIGSAKEFEKENIDNTLKDFLDSIALVSDVDSLDNSDSAVTLMTIHSAKGLEFKVVYVIGLEEGLFPSKMSINEGEIEEERRLCYVAITRAKNILILSSAKQRTIYGSTTFTIISRFVNEIDKNVITEGSLEKLANQNKKTKDTYIDNEYDNANKFLNYEDKYSISDNKYSYYSSNESKSKYNEKKDNDSNKYSENTKDFLKSFYSSNVKNLKEIAKEESESNIEKFKQNMKVKHKKYGIGVIQNIYNEDDILITEVDFEKFGMKRLILATNTLEVI